MFGNGSEDMGYEREDIEAQGVGRLVVRDEALRDQDSPSFEIDLPDAGLHERQEQPALELQRVVGRPRHDIDDRAQPAASLLFDLETDELKT